MCFPPPPLPFCCDSSSASRECVGAVEGCVCGTCAIPCVIVYVEARGEVGGGGEEGRGTSESDSAAICALYPPLPHKTPRACVFLSWPRYFLTYHGISNEPLRHRIAEMHIRAYPFMAAVTPSLVLLKSPSIDPGSSSRAADMAWRVYRGAVMDPPNLLAKFVVFFTGEGMGVCVWGVLGAEWMASGMGASVSM
jgi:hypothetical protein